MTPGIKLLEKNAIAHWVHAYSHEVSSESYGSEAAEKLAVPEQRVFKTLVVSLDSKQLVTAVVPVSAMLSMKLIAKVFAGKKATMADKTAVERSTGYVLGGVSPLGQKKPLKTVIDATAQQFSTVFVSAGKRGLEIELSPQDLQQLTQANLADICQ